MKLKLAELRSIIREMLYVRTMVAPSVIEGNGLYAGEFIPKGKIISKWVEGSDRTFPYNYPDCLPEKARKEFIELASCDGDSWFLSGDNGAYFNHSLTPNVFVTHGEGPAATWDRIAARDILPGEELTMNYHQIGTDSL